MDISNAELWTRKTRSLACWDWLSELIEAQQVSLRILWLSKTEFLINILLTLSLNIEVDSWLKWTNQANLDKSIEEICILRKCQLEYLCCEHEISRGYLFKIRPPFHMQISYILRNLDTLYNEHITLVMYIFTLHSVNLIISSREIKMKALNNSDSHLGSCTKWHSDSAERRFTWWNLQSRRSIQSVYDRWSWLKDSTSRWTLRTTSSTQSQIRSPLKHFYDEFSSAYINTRWSLQLLMESNSDLWFLNSDRRRQIFHQVVCPLVIRISIESDYLWLIDAAMFSWTRRRGNPPCIERKLQLKIPTNSCWWESTTHEYFKTPFMYITWCRIKIN